MPSSHRRHAGWTHERIQREATAIGPDTATLVEVILRSRPHPEQGFRACLGILRLARYYGVDRLEAMSGPFKAPGSSRWKASRTGFTTGS
jgi:transposase